MTGPEEFPQDTSESFNEVERISELDEQTIEENVSFFETHFDEVLKSKTHVDIVDKFTIGEKEYPCVEATCWMDKETNKVKLIITPQHKNIPRNSEKFTLHISLVPITTYSPSSYDGKSFFPPLITKVGTSENFTSRNKLILEQSIDRYNEKVGQNFK